MGHNNGVITSPVTTEDIRQTLGLASRQVGYLCSNKHGMTNKWSKHKPYRKNTRKELSVATDPTRIDGQVWGMKPPIMTNNSEIYFNSMVFNIVSGQGKYPNWEYQPPRGDEYNEPCRMLDFKQYRHYASQPFDTGIQNYTSVINLWDSESITFYLMENQNSDFRLSEFWDAFTQYHFVVEIYLENGTPWYDMSAPTYRYVSDNPITEIQGWAEYITVKINDLWDTSQIVNKTIFVLLGIQNIQSGKPEGGTGIVAPWRTGYYPFYKEISFENYFNRVFKVTAYNFDLINPKWYQVSDYPKISFIGTRTMIMKCEMEKKDRALYILPEHPTYNPPGSYSMKIRATGYGSSFTSSQYATLCNGTNFAQLTHVLIESSSEGGKQEFYIMFNNILRIGTMNDIAIEGTTDNGKTWVMMDVVGVNITCT